MEHSIAKIAEIVACKQCDRRAIFQLGYNLGRLSELTEMGRETFWDPWKDAVIDWNQNKLEDLVRELQQLIP